jgi:hypothetical protein
VTLVRKADHMPAGEVGFRHLWGRAKPVELTATAEAEPVALYDPIEPVLPLGLPFVRTVTSEGWFDWPALSDLFPRFFAGVVAGRDGFLMDTDIDRLRRRLADYFDSDLSHEEIARRYPRVIRRVLLDSTLVRHGMRCSNGVVLSKLDSCAMPTAHSIIDGCTGRPKRNL